MSKPNPASFQSGLLLASGIVALWSLDDGSGTTVTDNSGNSHDGTIAGGAAWNGTPDPSNGPDILVTGAGQNFNPSNGAALHPTTGGISFALKWKSTNNANAGHIAGNGTVFSAGGFYITNHASNGVGVFIAPADGAYTFAGLDNNWHDLLLTVDFTTKAWKFYLDSSTPAANGTLSGSYVDPGSSPFILGASGILGWASSDYAYAVLWNRALSSGEATSYLSNPYQLIQVTVTPGVASLGTTGATKQVINWTAASSGAGFGATPYQVQRAPDSAGSPGVFANVGSATGALTYTDTGLTAATKYWWRVVCTDSGSNTANTNNVTATTGAALGVGTATFVHNVSTAHPGRITVHCAGGTGGDLPYSYQLYTAPDSSGSPGAFTLVGSATFDANNDTPLDLTPGTLTWVRVKVTDAATTTVNATSIKTEVAAHPSTSYGFTFDPTAAPDLANPYLAWFLDTDIEAAVLSGYGSFVNTGATPVVVSSLRNGKGWKAGGSGAQDQTYIPVDGILNDDEVTVCFQVRCDSDWASQADSYWVEVGGSTGGYADFTVGFNASTGKVEAKFFQTSGNSTIAYAITVGHYLINTDYTLSVSITSAGVANLHIEDPASLGTMLLAGTANLPAPIGKWGGSQIGHGGVVLCGAQSFAFSNTHATISNAQIFRKALIPGTVYTAQPYVSLTVDTGTSAGTFIRNLTGAYPWFTDAFTQGYVQYAGCWRDTHCVTNLPIKVGAPNGTYPTAGISGSYSYDFQLHDRDFAIKSAVGTSLVLGMDGNHQLTGGSVAPVSGSRLTTGTQILDPADAFDTSVPNDTVEFAAFATDLAYHAIIERGATVPYIGAWNEIDLPGYWGGTQAQGYAQFKAIRTKWEALKVTYPTLSNTKLSCLCLSGYSASWVDYYFSHMQTDGIHPEALEIHVYLGDFATYRQVYALIQAKATLYSHPMPDVICTEGNPDIYYCPGNGQGPWTSLPNAFAQGALFASMYAAQICEMQTAGWLAYTATSFAEYAGSFGVPAFFTSITSGDHVFAMGNAMILAHQMSGNLATKTFETAPGLTCIATTGGKILLSNYAYRRDRIQNVKLTASAAHASGVVTVPGVIDVNTSNYTDAGAGNEALTAGSNLSLDGSKQVTFDVGPQSVMMLQAPSSGGGTGGVVNGNFGVNDAIRIGI